MTQTGNMVAILLLALEQMLLHAVGHLGQDTERLSINLAYAR